MSSTPEHLPTASDDHADAEIAPVRRGRGRRPAAQVREDVLRVAGALLLEHGMTALTFESVSRLSGVSRTTLYKWWPSPGSLALDGYAHAVAAPLHFPDTGDIRADIREQMMTFAHIVSETPGGRALRQLIGEAQTDPELGTAYRALYSQERRRLAVERMQRARDQGQLREDADLRAVVDQLWGAVYHRLLVPDEPVTPQFIDALIDNVFRGIAAEPR